MKAAGCLLMLFLISCSGPVRQEGRKESRKDPVDRKKTVVPLKVYSCEELLLAIVKSSDVKMLQDFPEAFLRIDDISAQKITVQLYANDISDRSG